MRECDGVWDAVSGGFARLQGKPGVRWARVLGTSAGMWVGMSRAEVSDRLDCGVSLWARALV